MFEAPDKLVVIPSFRHVAGADGRHVLTRKFVSGIERYARHWPGRISVVLEPGGSSGGNLDEQSYASDELGFELRVMSLRSRELVDVLRDAGVVMGATGYRQNFLTEVCRGLGVPLVYVAEYTLKTRYQIIRASVSNPLKRLRKYLWEWNQERAQSRAIAQSAGVQCNGTPTYDVYRHLNPNALLYFDTRVSEAMLADEQQLQRRKHDGPIRLLFSGRLIPMKGADHLVPVAKKLKQLGVDFRMTICGGGTLESAIRREIDDARLSDRVTLTGVLDFETELLPLVKSQCDLFVCCHRQGDPSCTYMETMSCGAAIVGYDNEAFRGIVEHSRAGWLSPMDRPDLLAQKIAELSRDRDQITRHALAALRFAREHTFEKTFARRIEHLRKLARPARATSPTSIS